ncbi:hypothetical protein CYY_009207 [Polysphondylium violaceum]|uniref:FNIP repeat-containing protein n=1 Tax=Polysphondylium violaceum TaxID=133409 RepID=A0A8J4PLW7_9MYCE|nr:hypothetical protein CYY_009207 [Polysphondylium violaceum]
MIFGISINDKNDPILFANQLPSSIKYYRNKIQDKYNSSITKNHIPQSVTSVYLEDIKSINEKVPKKVKTLAVYIKDYSRHKLNPNCLPESLTSLTYYDEDSDQEVDLSTLPKNLTYLNINGYLSGKGHESIKYFIGNTYKPFIIPSSVTYFKLCGGTFEDFQLPQKLIHLELKKSNINTVIPKLPNHLPPTLKSLSLVNFSNYSLTINNCPSNLLFYSNENIRNEKDMSYIPSPNVKKIILSTSKYMTKLLPIPESVSNLCFGCSMKDDPFKGVLPNQYFSNNLVKLSFHYFGKLKPGMIPSSVTDLELGYCNRINQDVIPNSVTKLFLVCNSEIQPIIIPNTVKTLSFLNDKQIYSKKLIPNSVETLKIKRLDFKTFQVDYLPNSISTLCIDDNDSYLNSLFEKRFQINFPHYNVYTFPLNINLVKFITKETRRCYHFMDQQVFMEMDFEKHKQFGQFKKLNI